MLWSGLGPVLGCGWYHPGQGLGKEKVPGAAPCPLQSGQSAAEFKGPGPVLVHARAAALPPHPTSQHCIPAPGTVVSVGWGGLWGEPRARTSEKCFPCVGEVRCLQLSCAAVCGVGDSSHLSIVLVLLCSGMGDQTQLWDAGQLKGGGETCIFLCPPSPHVPVTLLLPAAVLTVAKRLLESFGGV